MHLFTYGTLMFPEVWRIVVGRELKTAPAQLPGYQIFRVKGAVYPGIVAVDSPLTSDLQPLTSSFVPGLLYFNLDPTSLDRLDRFEGEDYRRLTVVVTCEDGRDLAAQAYVVPRESSYVLTHEIWTGDEFIARGGLEQFVAKYSGFQRLD
jgi:gamma-glutamylcyclotransferase (GGCT)/AIG2-like uncharacterized protein YtfP